MTTNQKWRAFRQTSTERFTLLPAFESNVPFLSALRSGLLTFFSSLVIQECLINFAGERLRSRMTSHCEIILGFYLSASHPELNSGVKLSSPSQKWRAFPQTSAERFTFLPAFESNVPFLSAMSHILSLVNNLSSFISNDLDNKYQDKDGYCSDKDDIHFVSCITNEVS